MSTNLNTHFQFTTATKSGLQNLAKKRIKMVFLPLFIALCFSSLTTSMAKAQGYGSLTYGSSGLRGAGTGINSGVGIGSTGGANGGNGQYYGAVQSNIDNYLFHNNKEMLRNDVDYEDYLLQKRSAFAQQMQQNDAASEKLRAYAEQRLKTLGTKNLSGAEQAEAHDLMEWLKKDAEQRANNVAWLERQDQALGTLEQDQLASVKNQRNAMHNMFEDGLNVESQFKWNQQMQLAQLHLQQATYGATIGAHQPYANQGYIFNGDYDNYGGYRGYGGGYNQRWGY